MADTTVGFEFVAVPGAREEWALVEGLRAGEEQAYETLLQRYEVPVYSLVARLLDDPADASDTAQEVFLKVFRKIGSFRGDSSLKTWVYRIAVNEARNHRRWFGRHKRQEVGLETDQESGLSYGDWLQDTSRSPFEVTLDHETAELIEAALAEVNPTFRAALVLREIEGLSYEEIANVMNCPIGTVRSRIFRAREAIAAELRPLLGTDKDRRW